MTTRTGSSWSGRGRRTRTSFPTRRRCRRIVVSRPTPAVRLPRTGYRATLRHQRRDAIWEEPGAITAGGVGYVTSAIDYAYEQRDQAAIDQLLKDIDFLLPYTTEQEIDGDAWPSGPNPSRARMARIVRPGRGHDPHGAGVGSGPGPARDLSERPRGQARLLPYVDGALRYTKHILYTRNDYPDVRPRSSPGALGLSRTSACRTTTRSEMMPPERVVRLASSWPGA